MILAHKAASHSDVLVWKPLQYSWLFCNNEQKSIWLNNVGNTEIIIF